MVLSACLIAKNESAVIEDCIKSLEGFDEIVVLDTGSEDDTKEKAAALGAKVFDDFTWCDDFAAARNHALTKCSGDWILSIDADEVLQPGGVDRLRNYVGHKKQGGLLVTLRAKGSDEERRFPRVFPKGTTWAGAIHEAPTAPTVGHTDAVIVYGSSPAHKKDPDRSLRILQKEHVKDAHNPRTNYYLAREYWYRKDFDSATKLFSLCAEDSAFIAEKADALLYVARCQKKLGSVPRAKEACLRALSLVSGFREAARFLSHLSLGKEHVLWRGVADAGDNEGVLFSRDLLPQKKIADVIIPHHNRHDLLSRCLSSLDNKKVNIVIVSGGSFAENCNKGARMATTDRLIFLNDDAVLDMTTARRLSTANIDLCGVAQNGPSSGRTLFGLHYAFEGGKAKCWGAYTEEGVHAPSGFCFMCMKSWWSRLGGFDERFVNGGEDADFGLRALEAGAVVGLLKDAVLEHTCSQSAGRFDRAQDAEYLFEALWPEERLNEALKKTRSKR
jgi:glycosyltransferase involved in cell wall biosynthesis